MTRIPVSMLRGHLGETVTIAGWVRALRLQRVMQFVIVRDHTGTVQITHRRDGSALEAELEGLTVESAVRVTGRVVGNPVVSLGGLEIIPDRITVENLAAAPLPVDDNTGPEGRVDVELAWISDVEDVMDFEERMLAHVLAAVAAEHGEQIRERFGRRVTVPEVPFPRITMAQAHALVDTTGEREDLDPRGERAVAARVAERTGHEFVFVTGYPASVRPFYHMRPVGEPDLTCSFDLLWRGLEITTGAQREHRYEVLLSQAAEKGLDPGPMRDYLDCFRYGCPPHGGLGLGLGRLLMAALGLDSIREVTFLFRGPNRLTP